MEDWPIVKELLASHDDNLKKVESLAQREIFSIEVPVFNGLRDVLPCNILTALRRMEYWFGKVPTIEHALCLVVLTDYVSCTYNQRNFFETFKNALMTKVVDSLFAKLYEEWRKVFCGRPLIHFTDSALENVRKSLSRSVDRFPDSFRHKFILNYIVQLVEKYPRRLSNENLKNVSVSLPKIQHPLVSSENFLWHHKHKDDSKNLATAWKQKKTKADITKYVVKKPMQKESTKTIPVPMQSTTNIHVATKKTVIDFSAASYTEAKAEASLEKLFNSFNGEDDSMDSVDVYLTRRSVYSPVASPSYCSGDWHRETVPSPIHTFFKEMERLNGCASDVSDSDEETMKLNRDSNYSEISDSENASVDFNPTSDADEEKIRLNCGLSSKTNEAKIHKNSEYSSLDEEKSNLNSDFASETVIDEGKLVNSDYLPEIVPEGKKNVSCDLPRVVIEKVKMNVANDNLGPISTAVSKELVVALCDCCAPETNPTSVVPAPIVSASAPKKKLNAFDILMRKVVPPKRKRMF